MGRPRSFDEDQVLDRAMQVFWRRGYDGASMSDLTKAMGINSPSLYGAFGSKDGLFLAVLDRYCDRRSAFSNYVLAATTARGVAERALLGGADLATDPDEPPGCLLVLSALACSSAPAAVPRTVASLRADLASGLRERLERARTDGDLPRTADPTVLARYLTTVGDGFSLQAAVGATRAHLRAVARMALTAWPTEA